MPVLVVLHAPDSVTLPYEYGAAGVFGVVVAREVDPRMHKAVFNILTLAGDGELLELGKLQAGDCCRMRAPRCGELDGDGVNKVFVCSWCKVKNSFKITL